MSLPRILVVKPPLLWSSQHDLGRWVPVGSRSCWNGVTRDFQQPPRYKLKASCFSDAGPKPKRRCSKNPLMTEGQRGTHEDSQRPPKACLRLPKYGAPFHGSIFRFPQLQLPPPWNKHLKLFFSLQACFLTTPRPCIITSVQNYPAGSYTARAPQPRRAARDAAYPHTLRGLPALFRGVARLGVQVVGCDTNHNISYISRIMCIYIYTYVYMYMYMYIYIHRYAYILDICRYHFDSL